MPHLTVCYGDNLTILPQLADASVDLVYIDPPFNTGKQQTLTQLRTVTDAEGDRTGYGGRRFRTIRLGSHTYSDVFDDYMTLLEPRLEQARRILKPDGSLFFHIDYREVHYCRLLLDAIFGRASFMNEIIWAYDYGARSRRKWPAKHDNILWYAVDPRHYHFDLDACDRIPYMAPGLVGPENAARGKTPTDTWWHTIVSPNGKEKTGYPTQKPRGILDRIVKVHSQPGDLLCDFFAGSGTFGEAAWVHGRDCILVDNNAEALQVMERRFARLDVDWRGWPAERQT
ncbi:MAG: site-specific DNA-methyltransferase [Chloroflexi bacterium]|nr:site-specific DNA-methyltransferase [Chloroflexota bacterium]